ncbi:MAG: RNA polymerase factor sigma-54 [Planctomycetes bacterium]|nr:RNA polymerase factor sigma-54 [Planctomycetota bacterium]
MRLELSMKARLEQQLRLAPQIIQSIEILQLPTQDLLELIEQELAENELLERQDLADPETAPEEPDGAAATSEEDTRLQETLDRLESLEDWSDDFAPRRRAGADEKDRKYEALQNTASRPATLEEHLLGQLRLGEAAPRIRGLAEYLALNLDESGFLTGEPEALLAGRREDYTAAETEEALALLRSLDPQGIGARNVRECLLLQLDPRCKDYYLLRELIEHHFDDLNKNKLPRIAKATGQPLEKITELRDFLATLDPAPGTAFQEARAVPIQPDVVVEWVDGRYEIQVQENYFPRLGISPRYRELLEREKNNPKVREYIRKKLESARWLIESIEQRKNTLFKVSREIVDRQREFLDNGIHYLKPLKMQEVADALGIHVSTVSRAIADKWLQCPQGIKPLKFFFTGATDVSGGGVESRVSVKTHIQELIQKEDPKNPLSDEDIMQTLCRDLGLHIARRTVTKYRKALAIPSSRQRRQF